MKTKKRKKRILIVDDEDIHRMGLRDRLEAAGYEIYAADGGEAALQMVNDLEFQLIILDFLMPQLNGFETFRRFKEISVTTRTPVLVLTVVGLEAQVQALVSEGAAYLQKQHAPRMLVQKVAEMIGRA